MSKLLSKIRNLELFGHRRGRLVRHYFLTSVLLIAGGLLTSGLLEIYFRYHESREPLAKTLRLKLLSLEVRSLDDFDSIFARAKREGAQALVTTPDPRINIQQRQILDFAAINRLPAIYGAREFVEAGGLMSYAPSYTELYRRAADFVDKILKGAKPADIPFEQPIKLELVINLRTAKQIGVAIPPEMIMWADKVIE